MLQMHLIVGFLMKSAPAKDIECFILREFTPSYILHTLAFGTYILEGGYLPCKKDYKVMVFYMYTCFTILKSHILHVMFLQNLPTMNMLDPIFYRTLFYDFRQ
jgi:hypothetical protein